jgi:hypothetical protein
MAITEARGGGIKDIAMEGMVVGGDRRFEVIPRISGTQSSNTLNLFTGHPRAL